MFMSNSITQFGLILCGNSPAALECMARMISHGITVHVYGNTAVNTSEENNTQISIFQNSKDIEGLADAWLIMDFTPVAKATDIPAFVREMMPQGNVVYCAAAASCTATALSQWLGNSATSILSGMSGFTNNASIEYSVSLDASPEVSAQVSALWHSLGYGVNLVEDRVGLIAPRILATLINDIDKAMTLGVNYPKGLLSWADEIGLDYILALLDGLYDEYHQERYRAAVILRQYVRAGYVGKVAGRGFYTY
jgi:hypothetical protein